MLKFLTIGVLASTLGLGGVEAAQACGGGRCCVRTCAPTCAAPSCAAPAPAPMGHEDHAVPAPPPSAPQANAGTYRRYSYEPSMAAPAYRAPMRGYGSSNQFDAGRKIRGQFGN